MPDTELREHAGRNVRSGLSLAAVSGSHPARGDGTAAARVVLLGEVALRVNDLSSTRACYLSRRRRLQVWREGEGFVFFRVADGVEGHPQALVLFDRKVEVGTAKSTLDHVAFVINLEEYDGRRRQLEQLGLRVREKEFPFFQWRSLFVSDPEGNTVEFVCYDPSR